MGNICTRTYLSTRGNEKDKESQLLSVLNELIKIISNKELSGQLCFSHFWKILPVSVITAIEKFSIILVKRLNPPVFSSSRAHWMIPEVTEYQGQRKYQSHLLSWI